MKNVDAKTEIKTKKMDDVSSQLVKAMNNSLAGNMRFANKQYGG